MKFTKLKSLPLSVLTAAWLPVVLLFITTGWLSLIVMQHWVVAAIILLLPLLIPILNLHFKERVLPKGDTRLQISFYVSWFLTGIFLVNFSDTEESVRSIFTDALVKFFDRNSLNLISGILFAVSSTVSLLLLGWIILRAVADRISYKNAKRAAQSKSNVARNLIYIGITAGVVSSLAMLVAEYFFLRIPDAGGIGFAAALDLVVLLALLSVCGGVMMYRLKQPNSWSVSIMSAGLVGLVLAGITTVQDAISNPFAPSALKSNGGYITRYGVTILATIVAVALIFWACGWILRKAKGVPVRIILMLAGVGLIVAAAGLQSNSIQRALITEATRARQEFYVGFDFKLYKVDYLPGTPQLSDQNLYGSTDGTGSYLLTHYSGSGSYFEVAELNASKLPESDRNCGPSRILGFYGQESMDCDLLGTTHEGGRVYAMRAKGRTDIEVISVTLGDSRILVQGMATKQLDTTEAMRIANSLVEMPVTDIKSGAWWSEVLK